MKIQRTVVMMLGGLIVSFSQAQETNVSAFSTTQIAVSPQGDDSGPGSFEQPFATLERARSRVRDLKRVGSLAEPITVLVKGGRYPIQSTFTLDEQDSGTAGAPIVWQAASGEEVRLSGGRLLPSADFRLVREGSVSARLDPAVREKVVVVDLKKLGVSGLREYPDRFRGAPMVPELFFNDQRMTPARWPNEGWASIAKIIDSGTTVARRELGDRGGVFEYSGDRPLRWRVENGVWLLGYWCFDWFEEAIRIGSIDGVKHQITLARPAQYGIKSGNPSPRRYRAVHVLEELDQPGEYYIDTASEQLYFLPPAELDGARIVLSEQKGPVVLFQNVSHVTFRGFTVEESLGDGIEVADGKDNRIVRCVVRNVRQLGIRINGGTDHRVDDCQIHDTGTGGVVLKGGDRKALTPGRHFATNNRIWRFSQHQLTYASGISLEGVGNYATNNLLYDAPHMAVSIRGNDHVFEYNIVRDVCTESDDAGACYKGRNPSSRGNVIRYNLWSDIGSPMGHGTAAIYFDDGDGGETVFGNIFIRCGYFGKGNFGTIFCHGGHDNTAENNIFIECARALGASPWNDQRWQSELDGSAGHEWPRLLLEEVDITRPPYTTRYPALIDFMNPRPGEERINRAKNNVMVRCGQVTNSSGNWRFSPEEMWSTNADPGFVDAAKGDYRLRADSVVYQKLPNFQSVPFERIGPQRESEQSLDKK